jgi:cytosine deaminase
VATNLWGERAGATLQGVRRWPAGEISTLIMADGRIQSWVPGLAGGQFARQFEGSLVLPGLVNVHTHLDKTGLADLVPNASGTIAEARRRMLEAKRAFTAADVEQRASAALTELSLNGVTAVRSHVDVDPVVGLKGVEALLRVREQFAGRVDLQLVAFPQEGAGADRTTARLMRESLEMGVDVVGGHLSIATTPDAVKRELDVVFSLALRYDKDVDVHTDFGIDPDIQESVHVDGRRYPDGLGVVHLAERTRAEGYSGRVTASHVCGLSQADPDLRASVIQLLAETGVSVVALPASNLYAHGRADHVGARRGIAPVRELLQGGVRVAFATDNIRDPFDPFLGSDLLVNAVIAAIACHMVNGADFETVIKLHTTAPAAILGMVEYGLDPGCVADLVVIEARSVGELLDGRRVPLVVMKSGRLVAETRVTRWAAPAWSEA